jgi:hypothetical protein
MGGYGFRVFIEGLLEVLLEVKPLILLEVTSLEVLLEVTFIREPPIGVTSKRVLRALKATAA